MEETERMEAERRKALKEFRIMRQQKELDEKYNHWHRHGVSGEQLLNNPIKEIPCVLTPVFQQVGLACIAGSSDAGKSSFLRNLCMNVVAGKDNFIGFGINAIHRRTIYVSTEDDQSAVNYLLNKQNEHMKFSPSDLKGLIYVFETDNLLDRLDKMMTELPVDIVCVDAFSDLYSGGMNDNNQVRNFLNQYSQLAQKHGCLVIFLHHCGKRTENQAPSKNNLIGSQGFEAKMRLVMELRCDTIEAGIRHLCILKGNYLPSETKNESYKLRFTENMTFENTGERVAFEFLKKTDDDDRLKFEQILEYQKEGLTQDDIAKKMGFANRSSISRLIKKFKE